MSRNLTTLHKNVEKLYGKEQKKLVIESTNSIIERQNYAHFHFNEAVNTFNGYFENRKSLIEAVRLALSTDSSESEDFEIIKLKTQAHIFGFMQNMHSVSDILSHAIFYSIGFNLSHKKSIPINYLSIHTLVKFIKELNIYSDLAILLEEMIEHDEYKYLADVVNHSKHRSIIEPFFNVNLKKPEGEYHEIKFKSFSFKGSSHSQRLVFDFMKPEYDRQSKLIVTIVDEINSIVSKKC